MDKEWIAPIAGLAGAVIGIFGNHLLSRGKFFREREWEKRREIYSEMIAGLVLAVDICTTIDDEYTADPHSFDRSGRRTKLTGDVWEAYHKAETQYMKNYLFLSCAVRDRFHRLQVSLRDPYHNELPMDIWSMNLEKLRSARDDIMREALRETSSHRWRFSFKWALTRSRSAGSPGRSPT